MGKHLIIFTDIGDTIIDESTEVRDIHRVVQRAACIPGARETTLRLYEAGYTIVMVADGLSRSFHNLMDLHGLSPVFSAWVISEEVGEDKPSPKMFETAMQALHLTDADKHRIIMVGNNVKRDMRGANRFGIRSVLMDWSKKRPFDAELPEDKPDYVIHEPSELFALCPDAYAFLLDTTAARFGRSLEANAPSDCGLAGKRVYGMHYLVLNDAFSLPLKNGFCCTSY